MSSKLISAVLVLLLVIATFGWCATVNPIASVEFNQVIDAAMTSNLYKTEIKNAISDCK